VSCADTADRSNARVLKMSRLSVHASSGGNAKRSARDSSLAYSVIFASTGWMV
jgi:hypothetical protein